MNEDAMPKDFTSAVKDIKLAILQARARAAQLSNIEALKLYFYVGGYISKKTRSAKWGTGATAPLTKKTSSMYTVEARTPCSGAQCAPPHQPCLHYTPRQRKNRSVSHGGNDLFL